MAVPALVKPIPAQVINEGAAYGPFDLKNFIQTSDQTPITFSAELSNNQGIPKGLICTADGFLTGIPAKGTSGNYNIKVTAENADGPMQAEFVLVIKPALSESNTGDYFDKLKAQVWEAVQQQLPIPDLTELMDRAITPYDVYYIIERWGILTIWDVFNLDAPGEKRLLDLPGVSKHYNIYDRGSCLVATPKDLFSHERTLADGLITAQVMAREAYKRNWTIEFVGFDKLIRAAWVELQLLSDQYGRAVEIVNYNPTSLEVKLYADQAYERKRNKPE